MNLGLNKFLRNEGRLLRRSTAPALDVLEVDDCLLLGQECGQMAELETFEFEDHHNLEICPHDFIQHQIVEITSEPDLAHSKGVVD